MRVGIVGGGAIGLTIARVLIKNGVPGAGLAGIVDCDTQKMEQLKKRKIKVVPTLEKLITSSDLIIEAAGSASVPDIARLVLKQRKALMVLSVGALLESPGLIPQFHQNGCRLYFPSGAVAGLDALKAAKRGGGLKSVKLITTKPPAALSGAPFFKHADIQPEQLKQATTIFKGSAGQAVKLFPANVNVAAAISLAGIGARRTQVEIVADPKAKRNKHVLQIEGRVGRIECVTENVPSPQNQKTSYLATASALALLSSIVRHERFGT